MFVGKPVPLQETSDKVLRELGYDAPNLWVQYCIQKYLGYT